MRHPSRNWPNQRLQEARNRNRWTQEHIAKLLDTTQANVSRWELGMVTPGPYYRLKLCELFGRSAEELGLVPPAAPDVGELSIPLWNVPYPRNPFFTGREEVLALLHDFLPSQPQAISGLGGIGKTQLALEYAYRHQHVYQAVLWARAESTEALVSSYIAIATLLQLPEGEAKEQEVIVKAVKTWLQIHHGWLLILDNADDLTLIPNFLPSRLGGHLLLTTRAAATGRLAHRLQIETFLPEQGALFLLRRAALIAPDAELSQAMGVEQEQAKRLTLALGGLPLALDQAGAYLEEIGMDLASYEQLYQQYRTSLLQRRGGLVNDHPAPVATTWDLSFQRVEERNPAAADLLRLCAFLSPDAIAEEILTMGASSLGPTLASVAADAFLLNQAIEILKAHSLMQRDSRMRTLSIHRLVQAVLQDTMEDAERCSWAVRAVRAMDQAMPDPSEFTTWQRCQRMIPHAQACGRLIDAWDIISEEAGRLLYRVGLYYTLALGQYDQAAMFLEKSAAIRTSLRGPEHLDVAESINLLGEIYLYQGRYALAEPLFLQALSIREQHLEPDHPAIADASNNLGVLYMYWKGKYAESEALLQRTCAIWVKCFGHEHPNVAHILNNLAYLFFLEGRHEEAQRLHREALATRERVLEPGHPHIAESLNNLGLSYREVGRYAEAEPLFQRAIAVHVETLGKGHPNVAQSLNNLARLYAEQGKSAEAEPLFQQALSIYELSLGAAHPRVAGVLNFLADLYLNQGKYAEAEALLQRALSMRELSLGAAHPDLAQSLETLARIFEAQGRHAEAEPLLERALAIREQKLGRTHPDTSRTLLLLQGCVDVARLSEQKERQHSSSEMLLRACSGNVSAR